jgi:bacterioferritin (cytochrome b1)
MEQRREIKGIVTTVWAAHWGATSRYLFHSVLLSSIEVFWAGSPLSEISSGKMLHDQEVSGRIAQLGGSGARTKRIAKIAGLFVRRAPLRLPKLAPGLP